MKAGTLELIRLELFKILRKKESYLFFAMWAIPLIYGWGFGTRNENFIYRGTEPNTALDWIQTMSSMCYQSFIFYIFLVIIAGRALGGEIDEGSLLMYIPRVNNRGRIFAAKLVALVLLATGTFLVYLAVSFAVYYLILTGLPHLASGEFGHSVDSTGLVLFVVMVYLSFVLVAVLSLLLSLYLKPLLAIATATVIMLAVNIAAQIPPAAYVNPWYYLRRMLDSLLPPGIPQSGNPNIRLFSTAPTVVFALSAAVTVVLAGVMYGVGSHRFRVRDL